MNIQTSAEEHNSLALTYSNTYQRITITYYNNIFNKFMKYALTQNKILLLLTFFSYSWSKINVLYQIKHNGFVDFTHQIVEFV